MKINIINLFLSCFFVAGLFLFTSCGTKANKESEFWVRGNCEMCKERIETTLKSVKGVTEANWDVESGMLKVSYDSTQVKLVDLEKAVARVGHETKSVAVDARAHNELPECCQKHTTATSVVITTDAGVKCCNSSCCDHKNCKAMDGKEKCGHECCKTDHCTKVSNSCCVKSAASSSVTTTAAVKCCNSSCCDHKNCKAMDGKEKCGHECCTTDKCKKAENACCHKS